MPDKEIIRQALAISPPVMKAIILFSCSSGCARAETLSLTIQDYIDALSEYLPNKRMDIYQIIDYLNDNDNVVPTFNLRRIKTNKYYTTYCSPEAVKAINAYILTRTDNVTPESQLFRMYETYFIGYFKKSMMNLASVESDITADSEAICLGNSMLPHCTMTA